MSTYLALTAQRQLWPAEGPIALLGPWCDVGIAPEDDRSRYVRVMSPYQLGLDQIAAGRECERRYFSLVDRIGEAVASLGGRVYNRREWRTLNRCWLIHAIDLLFDREARLRAALGQLGDEVITTGLASEDFSVLGTTVEIETLFNDEWFNLQLFTQVCDHMGIALTRARRERQPASVRRAFTPELARRLQQVRWLRPRHAAQALKLVQSRRQLETSQGVLVAIPEILPREREWLGRRSGWAYRRDSGRGTLPTFAPNLARRRKLEDLPANDDFERLVFKALPFLLPPTLFEGYEFAREAALRHFGRQPRHVLSSRGPTSDDVTVHYMAYSAGAGKRMVGVQHGGGYGHYAFHTLETIEVQQSDCFITWGWRDEAQPSKAVPLAAPTLSRIRDRHRERNSKIILVTNEVPRYFYRYQACPMPEDWPAFYEQTALFGTYLPDALRAKLIHRLLPKSYGWNPEAAIRRKQPDARFLTRGSLLPAMAACRLVVMDHPSSSFIEALAMNTPLVMFFDPRLWPMRQAADARFARLRQAGILHDNVLAAANQVAGVYHHANEWWLDPERQQAREDFLQAFGRTAPDWRREWLPVLGQITDVSENGRREGF